MVGAAFSVTRDLVVGGSPVVFVNNAHTVKGNDIPNHTL